MRRGCGVLVHTAVYDQSFVQSVNFAYLNSESMYTTEFEDIFKIYSTRVEDIFKIYSTLSSVGKTKKNGQRRKIPRIT